MSNPYGKYSGRVDDLNRLYESDYKPKVRKILDLFINKHGLSYNQAIAVASNIYRESGYDDIIMTSVHPKSKRVFGAYQYTGSSFNNFRKWAAEGKKDMSSLDVQTEFMFGPYGRSRGIGHYNRFMKGRDADKEYLADLFMKRFEAPADREIPQYIAMNKALVRALDYNLRTHDPETWNLYNKKEPATLVPLSPLPRRPLEFPPILSYPEIINKHKQAFTGLLKPAGSFAPQDLGRFIQLPVE